MAGDLFSKVLAHVENAGEPCPEVQALIDTIENDE